MPPEFVTPSPSISAVSYALAARTASVAELAAEGQLESDPDLLAGHGFETVRIATDETPYELGLKAARALLDEHDIDPESIGLLLYGGPSGPVAFDADPSDQVSAAGDRSMARFHFPGTRLQHELGLSHASTIGVGQLACTTLLAAVRVASAICVAEGVDRALCVVSEFFPADAGRESIYNCTSDAGVAVLVDRVGDRNRLVATTHVTKGYYWEADVLREQIVASYFPTARHVILRTIKQAGWMPDDVDWIIPHNVSEQSWQILLGLAGCSRARLWSGNIGRIGHTLSGDNFINLADAMAEGVVEPGHRVILFSYGFGAHWVGLAVEA